MNEKFLTISETAKMLGVSIDTLRRWDKNEVLKSFRATKTSKRLYRPQDIEDFFKNANTKKEDFIELVKKWTMTPEQTNLPKEFYCQTKDIFEARYVRLINQLPTHTANILVAITSEIGNNSYDHNIGKWEDAPGIFFAHDTEKREIILADRGQGILKTLQKIKPELKHDKDALYTAFTEIVSGRAPEARGNGLKFVRRTIENYPFSIIFQTGSAVLSIEKENKELKIKEVETSTRGCLTIINY